LNGLLWIIENGREVKDVYEQYKVFMREFGTVSCKIIMVVNGKQNYAAMSKKKQVEQKARDLVAMRDNGKHLRDLCGFGKDLVTGLAKVEDKNIFVARDVLELQEIFPQIILSIPSPAPDVVSKVRTFKGMEAAYTSAQSSLESYIRDQNDQIDVELKALEKLQFYRDLVQGGSMGGSAVGGAVGGASATVWGLSGFLTGGSSWVIGGIIAVGVVVAGAVATGSAKAAEHCSADVYRKSINEQQAKLNKAREDFNKDTNKEAKQAVADERKAQFEKMKAYLVQAEK